MGTLKKTQKQAQKSSCCQNWDNMSIKMNNDSNKYDILNKKRIHEYILMQTNKMEEKLFIISVSQQMQKEL